MLQERLRRKKEELGITTSALSALSGVPVGTINKILNGETKSPRYDTLMALEKVLFPEEGRGAEQVGKREEYNPGMAVQEAALQYAVVTEARGLYQDKQGSCTLADYYALPENVRAELIDGYLIQLEAPCLEHQAAVMELSVLFHQYIRSRQGSCVVLSAPLDVQLDCDDRTMVQPDIVISCNKERRTTRGIYGAPDMVIEVTSAATRKLDLTKKMQKYLDAGVREYWVVDLQKRLVVVYFYEEDLIPHIYTFQDSIPVGIYQGQLKIDFREVEEQVKRTVSV